MLPFEEFSRFECGDMTVLFLKKDKRLAFTVIPQGMESEIPEHQTDITMTTACRGICTANHTKTSSVTFDGMIQLHVRPDLLAGGYQVGETMTESETARNVEFVSQQQKGNCIETVFREKHGLRIVHSIRWVEGEDFLEINTEVENAGDASLILDQLASFQIGMLSPFAPDDGPDRYKVHRYGAYWSAEGRHIVDSVEPLILERSWSAWISHALRFGQRSSLVVKRYFPTLGLEDTAAGVTWGVQLATITPWQLEINRVGDYLNMAGGLPDFEFAGWERVLKPGEKLSGPPAILSCARGDMDHVLNRITRWQKVAEEHPVEAEKDLPVIFNEYCTTWGRPTSERLLQLADKLKGHKIKYFVMDAGWFRSDGCKYPGIGDWEIAAERFPDFDAYIDAVYQKGFIPGIWFEFENFHKELSKLGVERKDLATTYHGQPCCVDRPSMSLDFRKQEVRDLMTERVIHFLKKHRIGYIKVDYNYASPGVDTENGSTAEGLRQLLLEVREFYRKMLRELPELTLEVCASGGHRLTAGWLQLGNMASFSDAHEDISIPLVASGTAMQIDLSKNQVWAVLRKWDDDRRICYTLAAGFIGRLCISGDVDTIDESQMQRVYEATDFYEKVKPLIRSGESRLDQRLKGESWNHPRGAQIFRRTNDDAEMLVIHTFANADPKMEISLSPGMELADTFGEPSVKVEQHGSVLTLTNLPDWCGLVILCKKVH